MKHLLFFILCLTSLAFAKAQTEHYNGILDAMGNKLPLQLSLELQADSGDWTATLLSPTQSDEILTFDFVRRTTDSLIVRATGLLEYRAVVAGNGFEGVFAQGNMEFPLTMQRGTYAHDPLALITSRPQDPTDFEAYHVEEMYVVNRNGDTLQGTLTTPKGKHSKKLVILISGSGPQDRNEELLNHRPFLVLSDHLTRAGIATYRYDERGVGASGGTYQGSTTHDLAQDVEDVIDTLEKHRSEIGYKELGLIGHSEGGLIAPMLASRNNAVDFVVMLAGPAITGRRIIDTQIGPSLQTSALTDDQIELYKALLSEHLNQAQSVSNDNPNAAEIIKADTNRAWDYMRETYEESERAAFDEVRSYVSMMAVDPWMDSFLDDDPVLYLPKVNVPVLALQGSLDQQVLAEFNLPPLRKALAKNSKAKVVELPQLNHLFQTATSGYGNEYATIEETMAPAVLELVSKWVLDQ